MFFTAFFGLDAFPVSEDFVTVIGLDVTENVRVTANEFVADGAHNVLDVKSA